MRDYLVRVSTHADARAAMPAWATKDEEGRDVFRLPQWCDILPADAYSAHATYDAEGNQTTPPTLASGRWFIVSLDREVQLPVAAAAVIQAQADREDGLRLPPGIVGLSTVWAGMTVVIR